MLSLSCFRCAAKIKGLAEINPYSLIYLYRPERYVPGLLPVVQTVRIPQWRDERISPPYFPSLGADDDLVRLMFVTQQTSPLRGRLRPYKDKLFGPIYEDANKLNEDEFISKHGLEDVFAHKVYSILPGCAFMAEYDTPELPTTDLMRLNQHLLDSQKTVTTYMQRNSRLIKLSKQELSEVVYLAYIFDKESPAGGYYEACSAYSSILNPLDSNDRIVTQIGTRLLAALSQKETQIIDPAASQPTNHP